LTGPPRDLVGYGRRRPDAAWPDGARVVVNLVLVYEEGAEYNVLDGDARNDGWGEYPDPGPQPPRRDLGTETHYEYGSRAGVWRLARIFDGFGVPVTVSACAVALERNPEVAAWMRERGHDLLGHGWRWTEPWTQSREEEREFQPSGGRPSTRWYVSTARPIVSRSSSRLIVHGSFQRQPWPSRSWSCARIHSATAGFSSSATAAAETVTGTPAASKMRASLHTPARLPYS